MAETRIALTMILGSHGSWPARAVGKGEMLARIGHRPAGLEPGQFISPHGLAVDSRGDLYVGEVSFTNWGNRHKGQPLPPGLRSLQKLVKVR